MSENGMFPPEWVQPQTPPIPKAEEVASVVIASLRKELDEARTLNNSLAHKCSKMWESRKFWKDTCRANESRVEIAVELAGNLNAVLRAEIERLYGLLYGARCVYCGEVVGKETLSQDLADEVLRQHVLNCPKHPATELRSALTAAEERARVAERELEECKQRKGKIAAYRIVTEYANAHLRNLLREKPKHDMDALISAFCMVYTSPAWGGDERSPEGWKQKEAALRKAFTSAISPERRFLSGLSILNKLSDENAALTASVEEWKRKAEEACKNLNGTRNDWQREFERGIELERELRSLRLSSIPVGGLSLSELRAANEARRREWDPEGKFSMLFHSNELAGETGEACNVVKKLERERLGARGSKDTVEHLAEELADVVIVADLVAIHAGIDLGSAVIEKFNRKSEEMGLSVLLSASRSTNTKGG